LQGNFRRAKVIVGAPKIFNVFQAFTAVNLAVAKPTYFPFALLGNVDVVEVNS
jgi:hypothetical protein